MGAPDIQRAFELSYSATTMVIFVVPGLVGLVVEPIVFLLADRYPRKWFIAGGLAAMATGSFLAALAPGPITLALALAVWSVATGVATSLAQATLVDRAPDQRARTMARWTLCSWLGDLIAPFLLGALAGLRLGWRAGFVVMGLVLAVAAFAFAVRRFIEPPAGDDGDEPHEPLWRALATALRNPVLVLWLFGTALCDLLDEILVVFASLHIRHELGASATWQGIILGAFIAGGALGLVILERVLVRHSERRVLIATCLLCAGSYVLWLAAPNLWLSAILMLPVGATSAPLYPLAAARAYACCPGRSGIVLAASHLFTPFGLMLPWLLGLVADHAGTHVTLALLIVQPLGLALLARYKAT